MAKPKISWEIISHGLYTGWDKHSSQLPQIRHFTHEVPARLGIEFGYIINIRKAKGKKLYFCIDHPPFKNESGNIAPPFDGTIYVKTNDWDFFLGDTFWEPLQDKVGPWRLTIELDGKLIADETFTIVEDEGQYPDMSTEEML